MPPEEELGVAATKPRTVAWRPGAPSNALPSIAASRSAPIPSPARSADAATRPSHASPRAGAEGRTARSPTLAAAATASATTAPSRWATDKSGDIASPAAAPARAAKRQAKAGSTLRPSRIGERSRLQPGAQRLHRRRPDARDLAQLVDRGDAAVLIA